MDDSSEAEVIVLSVRSYVRHSLSLRRLGEMMAERNLSPDYVRIWSRVQRPGSRSHRFATPGLCSGAPVVGSLVQLRHVPLANRPVYIGLLIRAVPRSTFSWAPSLMRLRPNAFFRKDYVRRGIFGGELLTWMEAVVPQSRNRTQAGRRTRRTYSMQARTLPEQYCGQDHRSLNGGSERVRHSGPFTPRGERFRDRD
jgi:hypothetical protein